jgi:4'-phosphopantetheinyl transferase
MRTPTDLEPGTIHVLRASLDAPPIPIGELAALVTDAERARAARFRQTADAHRHLIGRGVLRAALGRLVGMAPASIVFRVSDRGKPTLDAGPSFNISHSGSEVLVALALRGRLGVDVEAVRTHDDLFEMARLSFVASEVEALQHASPDQQLRHFFRVWARKEAMLKALGVGIGDLAALTVSGAAAIDNALTRIDLPDERVSEWVVQSFPCSGEVEAAVAWDQPLREVVVSVV